MKRLLLLILVFLIGNGFLFAEDFFSPSYRFDTRTSAIGGPHSALNDDLNSAFQNPAGFAGIDPQLRISEVSVRVSGPVFTLASALIDGITSDDGDLFSAITKSGLLQQGALYSGFTLMGPLSLTYAGNGLGFTIMDTVDIALDLPVNLTAEVSAKVNAEFLLAGGYAYRFDLDPEGALFLDAGILLKGMIRGSSDITMPFTDLLSLATLGTDTFLNDYPMYLSVGVGFDAGLRLSWKEILVFGLTAQDIYSPAFINEYSSINAFLGTPSTGQTADPVEQPGQVTPFNLSSGILYNPELGLLQTYFTDLKIMLDYNDILDFLINPTEAVNPLLHLGIGIEMVLLDIVSVRAGFYQGLFNAGLGLDLNAFQLNAAMFGRELSTEPGMNPVYNFAISFDFVY